MQGRYEKMQDIVCLPKCQKTQELKQPLPDAKMAMVFLKLRREGCRKRQAIHFCSKILCKSDVTKKKDGPVSCRVLKPIVPCDAFTMNGWELSGKREYNIGKKYKDLEQLHLRFGSDHEKVTQTIEKKLKNNCDDYSQRINILNAYAADIDRTCNLPKDNFRLLSEKIATMTSENQKLNNDPINHMDINGVKLYEIFKDYPQTEKEKLDYDENYINLFNSFAHFYNRPECKKQIRFSKIDLGKVPNGGSVQKRTETDNSQLKSEVVKSVELESNLGEEMRTQELIGEEFDEMDSFGNEKSSSRLEEVHQSSFTRLQKTSKALGGKKDIRIQLSHESQSCIEERIGSKNAIQPPCSTTQSQSQMKFIDLKVFYKSSKKTSCESQIFENTQEIGTARKTAIARFEQLAPLEFPKKLDWLIESAVVNRNSPRGQISLQKSLNTNNLNEQLRLIDQKKDRHFKKTLTSFYSNNNSKGFKTHADFFKSQKKRNMDSVVSDSFYNSQMSGRWTIDTAASELPRLAR